MYRTPQKFDNQIPKKNCQKKVTFSKSSCRVSMWVFVGVLISLKCLRSACLLCYSLPSICSRNLQVPGNVPPHFLDIISSYKSYKHYSGRQGLWILHQSTQQPLFKAWTTYQNVFIFLKKMPSNPPALQPGTKKEAIWEARKLQFTETFQPRACGASVLSCIVTFLSINRTLLEKNIHNLTLKKPLLVDPW